MLKKAHVRRYGALGSTLNVERLRLACGRRAPPRIWTFLSILRVFQHPARSADAVASHHRLVEHESEAGVGRQLDRPVGDGRTIGPHGLPDGVALGIGEALEVGAVG